MHRHTRIQFQWWPGMVRYSCMLCCIFLAGCSNRCSASRIHRTILSVVFNRQKHVNARITKKQNCALCCGERKETTAHTRHNGRDNERSLLNLIKRYYILSTISVKRANTRYEQLRTAATTGKLHITYVRYFHVDSWHCTLYVCVCVCVFLAQLVSFFRPSISTAIFFRTPSTVHFNRIPRSTANIPCEIPSIRSTLIIIIAFHFYIFSSVQW